jgi:hypothetical protein
LNTEGKRPAWVRWLLVVIIVLVVYCVVLFFLGQRVDTTGSASG